MSDKVAIQGIAGSFHVQAAHELLGEDIIIQPCASFAQVFQQLHNGKVTYGVVAVENSLHGSVNAVYRQLARTSAWVCGETFQRIEQYLIGPTAVDDLSNIQRVRSQAPALAQCELWLEDRMPNAVLEETNDTATSVRDVVKAGDPRIAAIAGKPAAELYKGRILAGPINDDPHNYTRFFLLSAKRASIPNATKTSIILETDHTPGALQRALQLFADQSINLSKLDSHPVVGNAWHYAFYLDFDAGMSPTVDTILKDLENQGATVTLLGSYVGGALPVSEPTS